MLGPSSRQISIMKCPLPILKATIGIIIITMVVCSRKHIAFRAEAIPQIHLCQRLILNSHIHIITTTTPLNHLISISPTRFRGLIRPTRHLYILLAGSRASIRVLGDRINRLMVGLVMALVCDAMANPSRTSKFQLEQPHPNHHRQQWLRMYYILMMRITITMNISSKTIREILARSTTHPTNSPKPFSLIPMSLSHQSHSVMNTTSLVRSHHYQSFVPLRCNSSRSLSLGPI